MSSIQSTRQYAAYLHGILLLLLALAPALPAAAQVTFHQTAINSGDTYSASIVAGDFDNDETLDLVTINSADLSFYKGLGGGRFAEPVNEPVPEFLNQVFAADLNHDGKLDLVIASDPAQPGGIDTLLGIGDGTFVQGTYISVTGTAGHIALADFNGDHQPDIAASVCNGSTCNTQVFLGELDGTFNSSAILPYGGTQLVAGDFDADGHQDIAIVASDEIVLYRGVGNGTFENPVLGHLDNVDALAVGDFYNNRIQSLTALVVVWVQTESYDVFVHSVRYSGGQLVIENQQKLESGVQAPYNQLAAGDLNGDFKDDVFLTGGTAMAGAQSAYLLGKGDGSFGPLFPAPYWGITQYLPAIRDLNLDSRHDVYLPWTDFFDNIGGAEILANTSATPNCKPPKANLLGVHICAPTRGQTVGKTFIFKAAGNASNGFAKRMELWIDGNKIAQNLEDQLRAKVSLTRGNHTASFVAIDSFDNHASKSVDFTASY